MSASPRCPPLPVTRIVIMPRLSHGTTLDTRHDRTDGYTAGPRGTSHVDTLRFGSRRSPCPAFRNCRSRSDLDGCACRVRTEKLPIHGQGVGRLYRVGGSVSHSPCLSIFA